MAPTPFPAYSRIFAPRAGWFGAQLVTTSVPVGTGATTLTNSTTTSVLMPVPGIMTSFAKAEVVLVALNMQAFVAGVPNSANMTAQAFRRINAGTPADQALTATLSMKSDIITTVDWTYAWPITATNAQCLFLTTDAFRIDLVVTDTVTTQPTVTFGATWAVRRVG